MTMIEHASHFSAMSGSKSVRPGPRVTNAIILALAIGAFMMGFAFSYYLAFPAALAGTAYLGMITFIS